MSGTSSKGRISAESAGLLVQIWEPGKRIVAITSSLSDLIEDGEYAYSRKSGVSIIFAHANGASVPFKKDLITPFGVPEFWMNYACKRSNGYFGSRSMGNGDIASWLRLIAKDITLVDGIKQKYTWPKMNLISRWYRETRHTAIVMFDAPTDLSKTWAASIMQDAEARQDLGNPFSVYASLGTQFVDLQNQSVWACRNIVRKVEKQRDVSNKHALGKSKNQNQNKNENKNENKNKNKNKLKDGHDVAPEPSNSGLLDYAFMHEAARHVIHVSETIDVGINVLESIEQSYAQHDPDQRGWCDFLESLRFARTMLASLKMRSDANKQRLENEISLSYNMNAQRDSQASVQMAAAALVFLPSTFVSAIFSTSFFNYDRGAGIWGVASQFWVYWVVAIPLTVVSILAWVKWKNFDEWQRDRALQSLKLLSSS